VGPTQEWKKREQEEYDKLAQTHRPKPPLAKNLILAFLVGGTISLVGQAVLTFFTSRGLSPDKAGGPTAATMIFLGALLTAIGIYDEIGRIGGAGSAIPITGFANSIVACALEFRSEGYIMGMAARMFQIAGPVIVYGVVSAFIVGILRYLLGG
jgi:stage V sporulation protein AC